MGNTKQYPSAYHWEELGSHPAQYCMGIDKSTMYLGKHSATLRCDVECPEGFGTLMQTISAANYKGKSVCFKGFVKAHGVEDWAGLWLRVDGPDGQAQAFDNMGDRPIKGNTDWRECSIVLDVPEDARNICFGALLVGGGQIWFSGCEFMKTSEDCTVGRFQPDKLQPLPQEPCNLDFMNN